MARKSLLCKIGVHKWQEINSEERKCARCGRTERWDEYYNKWELAEDKLPFGTPIYSVYGGLMFIQISDKRWLVLDKKLNILSRISFTACNYVKWRIEFLNCRTFWTKRHNKQSMDKKEERECLFHEIARSVIKHAVNINHKIYLFK